MFGIFSLLLVREEFKIVISKDAILSPRIEKNIVHASILEHVWEHHAPDHPRKKMAHFFRFELSLGKY